MLTALAAMLPPRLQPAAKAVVAAALTVAIVGVQWIVTGEFDRAELASGLTGVVTALFVFGTPNLRPERYAGRDAVVGGQRREREYRGRVEHGRIDLGTVIVLLLVVLLVLFVATRL